MKYQTAKQAAAFKVKAHAALLGIGAVPHPECPDLWLYISTTHGGLRLSACETAIRTCFDKVPATAPTGAPLNPYSGKWNFEFGFKPTQDELDSAINAIRRTLR